MPDVVPSPGGAAGRARAPLLWGGLALIAVCAILRAMTVPAPTPWWDVNLLIAPPDIPDTPRTGLTLVDVLGASRSGVGPSASMLIDALALVGAALAIAGSASGRRAAFGALLASLGSLAVLAHALAIDGGSMENLRVGSAWIAAVWSGLGVALAAGADHRARRMVIGLALGFMAALFAKGLVQVGIENPAVREAFRQERESILAARGWLPGSAQARLYERRLSQPDATGWFGLANVYASFAAAALVGLGGCALARAPTWRRAVLLAGAGAALAACALARSKGGFAAAGLGAGALTILLAAIAHRRAAPTLPRRLGLAVALGAPALALAAVAARGLVGERIGELSLLFRWHYMQGAVRVAVDRPILGVGPADFKSAYLLVRPPTSPEEVEFAHSLALDWLATLGLGGLAWGALLLLALLVAGRAPARAATDSPDAPIPPRALAYGLGGVALAGAVTALMLERGSSLPLVIAAAVAPPAGPVSNLALLAGLTAMLAIVAAWAGLGFACVRALESMGPMRERVLALALAAMLAAHAQVEVTGTFAGSASLLMVVLGACAALPPAPAARARAWAAAPALLAALVLALGAPRAAKWEWRLMMAAREVEPLARDLQAGDASQRLARAAEHLRAAGDLRPEHLPTARALAWVILPPRPNAGPPIDAFREAIERAERTADRAPESATAWGWVGTLCEAAASISDGPRPFLTRAVNAWMHAAALDPHGLTAPERLMNLYDRLGDADASRRWARRALEVDANLRLDPLKGLSLESRARAVRLAGSP